MHPLQEVTLAMGYSVALLSVLPEQHSTWALGTPGAI